MDLAENRFGKTWKHFLEVLKVDYNCSLADVCRDQHTTLGGMSSWMWLFRSGEDGLPPILLYHYTETRAKFHAASFLQS